MKITMNLTLNKVLIFAAGALAGSAVTWKLVKTKYEKIANDEIESMREYFGSKKRSETKPEKVENEEDDGNDDQVNYEEVVRETGYGSYQTDKLKEEDDMGEPYVISPEEFDEIGYKTVTLYYYKDGVLATEMNQVIRKVADTVGEDFMNHFGEYEMDSVYVRNDRSKTDYEILRDESNFSENN